MTPAEIDALAPGAVLWDDAVRGLHVRAFPGRKSFYLYYRTRDRRERRPKIGDYGIITLSKARDAAREVLAGVTLGRDPGAEARAARWTVEDIYDKWRAVKARKVDADIDRLMRRDVLSRFGRRPAVEVTPDDIADMHRDITKRGSVAANRAVTYLSAVYNLAERRRWIPVGANPCPAIERNPERTRATVLPPESFPKLAAILARDQYVHPQAVAFAWLMLYSGARPSEVRAARWEWLEYLDDGAAILRLPDAKTGPRVVYLPAQAVAALYGLPRVSGDTITGLKTIPSHIWRKWRVELGAAQVWFRDLRRTFASIALANGQGTSIIGELLGHASTQTTKIYARLLDAPARAAVTTTANAIEAMLKGQTNGSNHSPGGNGVPNPAGSQRDGASHPDSPPVGGTARDGQGSGDGASGEAALHEDRAGAAN